jgi:hypothetical protein
MVRLFALEFLVMKMVPEARAASAELARMLEEPDEILLNAAFDVVVAMSDRVPAVAVTALVRTGDDRGVYFYKRLWCEWRVEIDAVARDATAGAINSPAPASD